MLIRIFYRSISCVYAFVKRKNANSDKIFSEVLMRIKELREEHRLTQKELAEKIGVAQSNISRWEKEEMEPAAGFVVKLADYFDVSADYLLGRTDDLGAFVPPRSDLSQDEQQLLRRYRSLTPASRALVSDMVATIAGGGNAEEAAKRHS